MWTPEKECSNVDPDPPETICLPLLDLQVLRILPLPPPTKWHDKHPTLTGPNTSHSSPALHPILQPLVKTVCPCDPPPSTPKGCPGHNSYFSKVPSPRWYELEGGLPQNFWGSEKEIQGGNYEGRAKLEVQGVKSGHLNTALGIL